MTRPTGGRDPAAGHSVFHFIVVTLYALPSLS
jgi:hypothetical protein